MVHTPQPGEPLSGDACLLLPAVDGLLVAVVDGLGHGERAHEAAHKAIATLHRHPHDDVERLLRLCHTALVGTRGAVMSLARLEPALQRLTWAGVGNVSGVLLSSRPEARPRRHLVTYGGIVGYQFPPLKVFTEPFLPGDLLVFATDGLRSSFSEGLQAGPGPDPDPQTLAAELHRTHARGHDDALVLVVQYPPAG
jgi:serine/threonine protein phosphatase PrpC